MYDGRLCRMKSRRSVSLLGHVLFAYFPYIIWAEEGMEQLTVREPMFPLLQIKAATMNLTVGDFPIEDQPIYNVYVI